MIEELIETIYDHTRRTPTGWVIDTAAVRVVNSKLDTLCEADALKFHRLISKRFGRYPSQLIKVK